jgi:hypothetical protein
MIGSVAAGIAQHEPFPPVFTAHFDFSATRPSTQHRNPTAFTVAGADAHYCARG